MSDLGKIAKSSIFKKQLMAVTGIFMILFLAVHLLGNLNLILPPLVGDISGSAFIKYAKALHDMPKAVLLVAEIGLLIIFIVHVYTGITLYLQNRAARPVNYQMRRNNGGRTLGSGTMIYTGLGIFAFIIIHLVNFTFSGAQPGTGIFAEILRKFHDPLFLALYVILVLLLGVHISHGFQSAFQTFGWVNARYRPLIVTVGMVIAVIFGAVFALIPVLVNAFYTV